MKKLIFEGKTEKEIFKFLVKNKNRKSINFLNQHDIYQFNKISLFSSAIEEKNNLNMIDGFFISAYLSFKNLKRIPRTRGPTFTRDFLSDKSLSGNKKHFFIGLEKGDLVLLKKKLPHLKKVYCYNPPYIKDFQFPKEEVNNLTRLINNSRADFVWVGIGCPKQNILAQDLFPLTKAQYYFNVGAAIDFLLGKKKEAPLWIRKLGVEWFYRLVTDFKYSKRKVWRSLVGVFYIVIGRARVGVKK